MKKTEEELGLEDWKHLLKYSGNNPKRGYIRKKIREMERRRENSREGLFHGQIIVLRPGNGFSAFSFAWMSKEAYNHGEAI